MTGLLDRVLSFLGTNADFSPLHTSWSNKKTPGTQWYVMDSLTIPAHSQYLIIAMNGNGIGSASICTCNFNTVGVPTEDYSFITPNNSGGGNYAIGLKYIKTGNTSVTVQIRGYGYNTSVTNMNGTAIAIPLVKNMGGTL